MSAQSDALSWAGCRNRRATTAFGAVGAGFSVFQALRRRFLDDAGQPGNGQGTASDNPLEHLPSRWACAQ
jgi:hypothetical protein